MDFFSSSLSINVTLIVSVCFMGMSLMLCFIAVKNALQHNALLDRRIKESAGDSAADIEDKKNGNLLEHLGQHLTLPDAEEISKVRYLLSQAGYFSPGAVKTYFAIRLLAIIIPQFILLLSWGYLSRQYSPSVMLFGAALLMVAGLFGPQLWVRKRKTKRTLSCREGFPDMMDLLVACIEAGLGLDAAMIRVGDELGQRYPALKVALDLMNLELRAGRDRHEALMNFAKRIDLEEAKALAVMLKQSEEMGSSLGSALRTFSEDMRGKRMLRAEEKALALSAKLTVPLIVFIFPTIMVMLLLPAGIRLAGAF